MKGIRETKASPKADLLVCFPSRAHHLTLMPKPICSPGRPSDPNKRYHLKKSSTTRSCGHGSPLLWGKTESIGSEPTSPKVTCAGQIRVRPKKTMSWHSAMEEIDKIHNHNETKQRKKKKNAPNWAYCLSFKKEAMHLLACFRIIRIEMRCFGDFNGASIATEEEEEDDHEYEDREYQEKNKVVIEERENEALDSVFSEWLMVLQEKQSNVVHKEDTKEKDIEGARNEGSSEEAEECKCNVPPTNALLLMRCSSAPVRSLLREKNEEQGKEENENRGKAKRKSLKSLIEENRKKENMLVMRYDSDFYKIPSSQKNSQRQRNMDSSIVKE